MSAGAATGRARWASIRQGTRSAPRVVRLTAVHGSWPRTAPPVPGAQVRIKRIGTDHVARFVSFLCSPAAQRISGQLFGVRGREVFLFSQPRPISRLAKSDGDWTPEALADAVGREFAPKFTALTTDLEEFNTDPLV